MSTATVLVRLEGPMQSWGLAGRGPNAAHRLTAARPTKSGIVGLVANALGRDRADDITDLAQLRFGVRVDRAGNLESDYHTTGSGDFPLLPGDIYAHPSWVRKAKTYTPGRAFNVPYVAPADISRDGDGVLSAKPGLTVITRDWYLADASFLAGLSGPPDLTNSIAAALAAPARTLYLGRRAYLPSVPILAGHSDADLADALSTAAPTQNAMAGPLEAWIEPATADPAVGPAARAVHDQPISYHGPGRYGARMQQHVRIPIADADSSDFYTPDPALNPE